MNDPAFLQFPAPGEHIAPAHKSDETLRLLARRRSTPAIGLGEPGPSPDQVTGLLRIAARVPDHGKLAPWRFLTFQGESRAQFGEVLAREFAAKNSGADDTALAFERDRFVRAPLIIAVISTVLEKHKIPEWEQILSAGAVCQNLLIAASAMGFAAQWLTEWYAYDPEVKDALGLRSGERVAGFVYIGTAADDPMERPRPEARIDPWRAR